MSRRARRSRTSGTTQNFAVVAVVIALVLFYIISQQVRWHPYQTWLVVWSITAFAFYGWDKSQAQRGGWRVPEMVLHGLALIGGVAGCWAGMLIFRHKTQHSDFVLVLIFATILHGALIKTLLMN
jgi:uncharacterized membrane protein YsdA (DUF1294 family)